MRCLLADDWTGSGPPFFIHQSIRPVPVGKAMVAVAPLARAITTASLGGPWPGIAMNVNAPASVEATLRYGILTPADAVSYGRQRAAL